MNERIDRVSLVAGIAILAVGGLLILHESGVIDLSLNVAAAALAATLGTIMLISGLNEDGEAE